MYKTKQKTQLLDFFKNNTSKQFSINEIINEVCKNEGSGKSTVYRQIAKLVNDGEVLRLYGDDAKSVVYQYTGEGTKCDEHFHLKCTDCGRLIHLDCEQLSEIGMHIIEHHGFKIDTKKTVFYGTCMECSKN